MEEVTFTDITKLLSALKANDPALTHIRMMANDTTGLAHWLLPYDYRKEFFESLEQNTRLRSITVSDVLFRFFSNDDEYQDEEGYLSLVWNRFFETLSMNRNLISFTLLCHNLNLGGGIRNWQPFCEALAKNKTIERVNIKLIGSLLGGGVIFLTEEERWSAFCYEVLENTHITSINIEDRWIPKGYFDFRPMLKMHCQHHQHERHLAAAQAIHHLPNDVMKNILEFCDTSESVSRLNDQVIKEIEAHSAKKLKHL